jgi:hypothetical protein
MFCPPTCVNDKPEPCSLVCVESQDSYIRKSIGAECVSQQHCKNVGKWKF